MDLRKLPAYRHQTMMADWARQLRQRMLVLLLRSTDTPIHLRNLPTYKVPKQWSFDEGIVRKPCRMKRMSVGIWGFSPQCMTMENSCHEEEHSSKELHRNHCWLAVNGGRQGEAVEVDRGEVAEVDHGEAAEDRRWTVGRQQR